MNTHSWLIRVISLENLLRSWLGLQFSQWNGMFSSLHLMMLLTGS